jgi:hypothetical protein
VKLPVVPRRWSDDVDGIRWLPRMIDKARMSSGDALGAYLFGHSPVDRALLTRLGVTTAEFAAIVAASPDDGAILSALRLRGFDDARVRRWSDRLPRPFQLFISYGDIDEGYVQPSPFGRFFLSTFRAVEHGLMGLVRLIVPTP